MKEALKKQEPKPTKAFRDNYLAAIMAVAALLICSVASAQTDSLKYSRINGYGFGYKRFVIDSVFMVPRSTSPHIPYRAGAIRYNAADSTLQLWTGYQWNSIITGVGNGVDTAYLFNDSTIAIETPDQDFFVTIPGRHWTLQGILNNGSTLTENEVITLADSLTITSGWVIIDSLNLPSLAASTDTTTYKPTAVDASGNVVKMGSWLNNQNLQQVTDRGSKTTDTIIIGGIRTQHILTDTADKPTFRIILKPDTQNEVRYSWPYQLDSVAKWIRDSSTYYNTKAFLGLGDITDLGNETEFNRMDSFYRHIDTAGLAYMAIIGNHDYDDASTPNIQNRVSTRFNTYFGPSRFSGKPWYGGNLNNKNDNFYTKFEAEGHQYLVIGLEYNPRDSSLDWAQRVCDTFPDRETIVITHAYITAFNEKSVDTSMSTSTYGDIGNTGQEIWDKFIKRNKQVFLVANGHYIPGSQNLPSFGRIIQAGLNGNVVTQVMANLQSDTLDGYASGMGFLMTLDFNLQQGKINFNVYSPFLKKYHPTFRPFSIDYPAVNIEASTGVSSVNGNFNVAGEARFDSATYVTQLTKNRLMVTGRNGQLDTLENETENKFLASTGMNTRPRYRTLLSTDIPTGSGNYIQNQIASGQTSNFWAYNPAFPDFTGVAVISKTATYKPTLTSGVPLTLTVAHAGSNYGLGIQRASVNTLPAHLSFFHNTNSDFSTLVANGVGDQVGAINWHVVNSSLSITLPLSINAYVEKNDVTGLGIGLVFNTRDSNNIGRSTYLNSSGNLLLGGTSPTNPYKLYVKGSVAFDLGGDATGDMYYRNPNLTRLPIGTANQQLRVNAGGTAPEWFTPSTGITSINSQTGAITITGGIGMSVGTAGTTITVSRDNATNVVPLAIFFSPSNNSGTSETDLYTYTVLANTLNANGKSITWDVSGLFNDATSTPRVRLYFAGSLIYDSGVLTLSSTGRWNAKLNVMRSTSTAAVVSVTFTANNTTITDPVEVTDLSSQDFTTTNIIKVTGTATGAGGGDNDITAKQGLIMFIPAP